MKVVSRKPQAKLNKSLTHKVPYYQSLPGLPLAQATTIVAGLLFIYYYNYDGYIRTSLLHIAIVVAGCFFCKRLARAAGGTVYRNLAYAWLAKVCISYVVLCFGWIPQLDAVGGAYWGYDPQRYYLYSNQLIENGWDISFISINYAGIVYFYAAVSLVFGYNPFAPFLVNAMLTLFAALSVVRFACTYVPIKKAKLPLLAGLLMIPDVIWFDVMTARETLMASLVIIGSVETASYLLANRGRSLAQETALLLTAAVGVAAIRSSMIVPFVVIQCALLMLLRRAHNDRLGPRVTLFVLFIFAVVATPFVASSIGGYELRFSDTFATLANARDGASSPDLNWTQNSIGQLLIPGSVWEAFAYVVPRFVLYIVTPFPNAAVSVVNMIDGRWDAWQHCFALASACVNIFVMPYAITGIYTACSSQYRHSGVVVLPITYCVTALAVAGGNIIIHDRYRVMASMLLVATAWVGLGLGKKKTVVVFGYLWYSSLSVAALAVFIYKGVL